MGLGRGVGRGVGGEGRGTGESNRIKLTEHFKLILTWNAKINQSCI